MVKHGLTELIVKGVEMKKNSSRIKVSTIMPVYNSEKWLAESTESWLAQTIREKELICVDDCSTDNSRKIIEEYVSRNNNIRLYTMNKNGGAGSARNLGLKMSEGEYVSFLDADDCLIREDALEVLYEYASADNCNVAGGRLKYIDDQKNQLCIGQNKIEYQDLLFRNFQEDYFFTSYIYKKSFLIEKNIYFPEIRMYEDPPFLDRALNECGTIRKTEIDYYGYKYVEKKRMYTTDMLVDLTTGILMSLQYAERHDLQMLMGKIADRINSRYFMEIMIDGIRSKDNHYFDNLSDIFDLLSVGGYELDIIEYLAFIISDHDRYDDFLFSKRCNHIFEEGMRIAIYGAGNNGQKLYKLIKDGYKNIKVALWCDIYKSGQEIYGKEICGMEEILQKKDQFDVVVISIENRLVSKEIREDLQNRGIEEYKIREFAN